MVSANGRHDNADEADEVDHRTWSGEKWLLDHTRNRVKRLTGMNDEGALTRSYSTFDPGSTTSRSSARSEGLRASTVATTSAAATI